MAEQELKVCILHHLQPRCQAWKDQHLTYFHLQILIQKEVAQLQVPVNDTVPVQVLTAQDDLPQVVAGLGLGQRFPPLVQLQKRLRTGGWGGD